MIIKKAWRNSEWDPLVARETLKNCALVAVAWADPSHKLLFRKTVVRSSGVDHPPLLPRDRVLSLIKSLEIHVLCTNDDRGPTTTRLLKMFSSCQLESLYIQGGLFSPGDLTELRTCFGSLSGRLSSLSFHLCRFDSVLLQYILSIQKTRANVSFLRCAQDPPPKGIIWKFVRHEAYWGCCVTDDQGTNQQFSVHLSKFSIGFRHLETDFFEDGDSRTVQSLIETSAEVVTFLKLNFDHDPGMSSLLNPLCNPRLMLKLLLLTDYGEGPALLAPSLTRCVNLSKLVLNMKKAAPCIVDTRCIILDELFEANPPNLLEVIVGIDASNSLFKSYRRNKASRAWDCLDLLLRNFARSKGGFSFTMEATCQDNTIHVTKKRMPCLLQQFNVQGSLHVHDGESDICNNGMGGATACMSEAVLKEYWYESENE